MKLRKLIERINDVLFPDYQLLEELPLTAKMIVKRNLVNTGEVKIPLLILLGNAKFINRGSFAGIVITEAGDVQNYGEMDGDVYCVRGTFIQRAKSRFTGKVSVYALRLEVGAIFDGEIALGSGVSIEATLENVLPKKERDRILSEVKRVRNSVKVRPNKP